MKDSKLNNLLSIDSFSVEKVNQKATKTKRTEVAKDVLKENAYVVGKQTLDEKPKSKEDHSSSKGLNNLISLDDFTKSVPVIKDKLTKRTETAKDVLNEKKKAKDCDCGKGEKCKKDKKNDECCEDDKGESKKGLTAAQKKLPEGLQKAILKRQKK